MDATSFAELATWLQQAVSAEGLHLSILPVSSSRGRDTELFSRAYEFWKKHWFWRMGYQTSASLAQAHSEIFTCEFRKPSKRLARPGAVGNEMSLTYTRFLSRRRSRYTEYLERNPGYWYSPSL